MQPGYYPTRIHQVPPDNLGKAFFGSLVTHVAIAGALVASGFLHFQHETFGSQTTSTGSIGVDLVKSIPLPRNNGPTNPLANDTKAIAPEAPAKEIKLKEQVKEEPKDAIAIPEEIQKKKKKISPQQQVTSLFRPPEAYKPNKVYSTVPQQVSSEMYGMKGANGIDVGQESILGSRFGAYADLIRDRIAQHWNRSNLHSSPDQKCTVTFSIARDGTVNNVRILQSSDNYLLDTSAQRAILDASPLPPLPQQFPRNDATVQLSFQLKQ